VLWGQWSSLLLFPLLLRLLHRHMQLQKAACGKQLHWLMSMCNAL
jgi:hypothetical protein